MNITHNSKKTREFKPGFNDKIRDWAKRCFCGCHNTCLNGYHEFKNLGSKYNLFPLKNSCDH